MTVNYKIYEFPRFPIEKQVFYASGLAIDGGYTIGGARVMSNEPGGFGILDIQPAFQVNEFEKPETSWLMSKINGQILRVRLAPTPQIANAQMARNGFKGVPWDTELLWSNNQKWDGDTDLVFVSAANAGTSEVKIDCSTLGKIFSRGHLIGHEFSTYMIDEIDYDGMIATIILTLPLRNHVGVNDKARLRPFFTGTITNGSDIVETYDASLNGIIQMPKITMTETII